MTKFNLGISVDVAKGTDVELRGDGVLERSLGERHKMSLMSVPISRWSFFSESYFSERV